MQSMQNITRWRSDWLWANTNLDPLVTESKCDFGIGFSTQTFVTKIFDFKLLNRMILNLNLTLKKFVISPRFLQSRSELRIWRKKDLVLHFGRWPSNLELSVIFIRSNLDFNFQDIPKIFRSCKPAQDLKTLS